MKVVGVSEVKNEIDIVEAFVRHNCESVDLLMVSDNGSTDGTLELLEKLRATGSRIAVFSEPSFGLRQSVRANSMMRSAIMDFGADWVVPLDADEFIEPLIDAPLREVLEGVPEEPFLVLWNNFAWTTRDSGAASPNPVDRIVARVPPNPSRAFSKIVVPAKAGLARGVALTQGSHSLIKDGEALPAAIRDEFALCHFPIRSIGQFASKVATGYLRYLAEDTGTGGGYHYIEPFRALADNPTNIAALMENISLRFGFNADEAPNAAPIVAPLRYRGGPLEFAAPDVDAMANILRLSEELALRCASLRREIAARDRASLATRARDLVGRLLRPRI